MGNSQPSSQAFLFMWVTLGSIPVPAVIVELILYVFAYVWGVAKYYFISGTTTVTIHGWDCERFQVTFIFEGVTSQS